MENLTCVIDAQTLVENVHEIKDWVYNDFIRLHVPICTSEKVEQLYQAELKAQETLKDPQRKRSSYKTATRKDHPLFDVNPRIAREFLLRSQLDTNNNGVSFQQAHEQFTQWKEEEEQALKVEQTQEERPASFAQALLRKLNIAEDDEGSNGLKVPAKPRLVARDATAPKSPWKYHKVPTISSKGVPELLKPLLSCVLWRLHEYENNPLLPETCIMLTGDADATKFMLKFKIPNTNIGQLRQKFVRKQTEYDRDSFGQVEQEFAAKKREKVTVKADQGSAEVNGATSVQDIEKEAAVEDTVLDLHQDSGRVEETEIANGSPQMSIPPHDFEGSAQHPSQPEEEKNDILADNLNEPNSAPDNDIIVENSKKSERSSQVDLLNVKDSRLPLPGIISGSVSLQSLDQATEAEPKSISSTSGEMAQTPAVHVESSDDSDDEVVVFNPKARRLSGTPRASSESSKLIESPKPSTPISYLKALETGLPKRPISALKHIAPIKALELPILATDQTHAHNDQSKAPAEAKGDQQVKTRETSSQNSNTNHQQRRNRPQRPLPQPFTIQSHSSRQTPTSSPVPAQIQQRPPPDFDPLLEAQINKLFSSKAENFSRVEEFIALQSQTESQDDEIPSIEGLSVHNNLDTPLAVQAPPQHQQGRHRPYPRQPHRFDQGSPKFQRQPSKQQPPISYPTIIDPDDFDRSPIIQQPRVHTPNGNGNNNHHRMPGSPKRGGGSKTTESEVDFVLRSGVPRGSTRGKGKLWVP